MSTSKSAFLVFALGLLLQSGLSSAQNLVQEEPHFLSELLLPGRLAWGATALPTGEILAPCEDQTLSVLDAQAHVLARWKASSRFSASVSAAPSGPLQLLAVPMLSGRIEVLSWDKRTQSLASCFAPVRSSPALCTAWGPSGTLYAAWGDGSIEAWSPQGDPVWRTRLERAALRILVDESVGVFAFSENTVTLLSSSGRSQQSFALEGVPIGALQTMAGDVLCWTNRGLWRKAVTANDFARIDASTTIVGVRSDLQDRLVVLEPFQVRRLLVTGASLSAWLLVNKALVGPTLDNRGRIVVGTAQGLEVWSYDGRLLGSADSSPTASEALITTQGFGVWSSGDWKVRIWSGFVRPPFGWSGEGGGAERAWVAHRPASLASRTVFWATDAEFGYDYQLVATGQADPQSEVLDRFEAAAKEGTLLQRWPFANLILLKICRTGVTDIETVRGQVSNSWPRNRQRALALLSETAGPEDREELLEVLGHEYDPAVAAQGARALAASGWDGDGKLLRFLADLRAKLPSEAVVADAVVDAARTLWSVNGQSSDPVLVPLVTGIYQGPFSRSIKLKAQRFFQALMDSP